MKNPPESALAIPFLLEMTHVPINTNQYGSSYDNSGHGSIAQIRVST
jgi:hypothetical protein